MINSSSSATRWKGVYCYIVRCFTMCVASVSNSSVLKAFSVAVSLLHLKYGFAATVKYI